MFSLLNNFIPFRKRIEKQHYLYNVVFSRNSKFKRITYPSLNYTQRIISFRCTLLLSNISLVKFYIKKNYVLFEQEQEFLILSNNPLLLNFIPEKIFRNFNFKNFRYSLEVQSYNFTKFILDFPRNKKFIKFYLSNNNDIKAEDLIFLSYYLNDKELLAGTIIPLQKRIKDFKLKSFKKKILIALNLNSYSVLKSIFDFLEEKGKYFSFNLYEITRFSNEIIFSRYLKEKISKCVIDNYLINLLVKNKNLFFLNLFQKSIPFPKIEIRNISYSKDYREVINFLIEHNAILSSELLFEIFIQEDLDLLDKYALRRNRILFYDNKRNSKYILSEKQVQYLIKRRNFIDHDFILTCIIKYGNIKILISILHLFPVFTPEKIFKSAIIYGNYSVLFHYLINRNKYGNLNLSLSLDIIANTSIEIYNLLKDLILIDKKVLLDNCIKYANLDLAREIIVKEGLTPIEYPKNLYPSLS